MRSLGCLNELCFVYDEIHVAYRLRGPKPANFALIATDTRGPPLPTPTRVSGSGDPNAIRSHKHISQHTPHVCHRRTRASIMTGAIS